MKKYLKRTIIGFLFFSAGVSLKSEPIDSVVWSLLKNKKSPIEFSYFLSGDWRNPSLVCGVGDVGNNWTLPLCIGMKLTAFKGELLIYCNKDNELGKAKDLQWNLSIFAGYGICFGGNWNEHWTPQYSDSAVYPKVIERFKNPLIQKAVWNFIEPALKYQVKSMQLKFQGILVLSYEYVANYFKNYDVNKAKEWYDKDAENHEFASKDYLGMSHPSRKISALVERLMFKWKIIDYKTISYWSDFIGIWLKKTLGANYNKSKEFWGK